MNRRILRGLAFALAVVLVGALPAWAQSKLKWTPTTICYVDFGDIDASGAITGGGSNANTGSSAAQAWQTLDKVRSVYFPGTSAASDPIRVLVIMAGTSGGYNTVSTGIDQFTYDATFGVSGRTAETSIAFRAWTEADGARPSSRPITRPVLRADNRLAITSGAGWTDIDGGGAGTIYESNDTVVGTPAAMAQLLYKTAPVTPADAMDQTDSDGAWKVHLKLTTGNAGSEALADTAAAAACTTAWSAYYDTGTKRIYINNGTGSPTTTDYAWVLSQTVENFSKIRTIGFDYVGCEGFDTLWGERGIIFFGKGAAEVYDCRVYEPKVHGIMCSYGGTDVLSNIVFDGCEVHGLGSSSTGQTMIATAGSTTADVSNVRYRNCKLRRYMLQNPAGAKYTGADYYIFFTGIGTAAGSYGTVLDVEATGCTFEDVSIAKTAVRRGDVGVYTRHATPADLASFASYPVRYDRCNIKTFGAWLEFSDTNEGTRAVAYNNCKIYCSAPDTVTYWGIRAHVTFRKSATGGVKEYVGIFGGTEWTLDIGRGDGTNVFSGFGPYNNSTAGQGNGAYITARDSTITLVSKAKADTPIFEQNSGTNDSDNKYLVLDVQRCVLASVNPVGMTLKGQLVYRDLPTSGNTARVFLNNKYIGINPANFTQSNATYAGFITNVDPYGVLANFQKYHTPDYAPVKVYPGLDRSTR